MTTDNNQYKGSITADTTLTKNFSATEVMMSRYSSTDGAVLAVRGDDADWDGNFLVLLIPVQNQTSGSLEVSESYERNKARIHFNRFLGGEEPVRGYAQSGKITFEYDQQGNTVNGTGHFKVRSDDLGHEYTFEKLEFSVQPVK
ncbi:MULTISPECIES: hypothetical protein [unclassified Pseudomonas]|uniref:hypothetical protein n=1 Tax=unclassified Pseudomonas TaxID=196821 RepID=UPI0014309249|nr:MULTISPECIES: hypothetical protein [unclassified Pseudomonas]MBB6290364.1 hypothetical protein [Pseudomonas sp. SJZ073]MBB6315165.1 hypothetical protein [Pseudomonas sp. JAI120]NJJ57174.1 hypothetical protein [Pseudomonas sp. B14(2022)]